MSLIALSNHALHYNFQALDSDLLNVLAMVFIHARKYELELYLSAVATYFAGRSSVALAYTPTNPLK